MRHSKYLERVEEDWQKQFAKNTPAERAGRYAWFVTIGTEDRFCQADRG